MDVKIMAKLFSVKRLGLDESDYEWAVMSVGFGNLKR